MTVNNTPIPKRLKQARVEAGLSQKELGISAGMDEFSASSRMNQYETGKHVPDFLTLKNIGKILNCPVAYFYAEDDLLADLIIEISMLNKKQKKGLLLEIKK